MSEEQNKLETANTTAPATAAEVQVSATAPATEKPAEAPKATEEQKPAPAEKPAETATPTKPQVVVQKERGFSHYVGFALLCVLCVCFFFIPGIAVSFAVSRVVELNPAAAWMFSGILSFIFWLIFKLKIKGFKKSFYFYIGLCVLVVAILVVVEVLTEQTNVFANILSMLVGASS